MAWLFDRRDRTKKAVVVSLNVPRTNESDGHEKIYLDFFDDFGDLFFGYMRPDKMLQTNDILYLRETNWLDTITGRTIFKIGRNGASYTLKKKEPS